LFRFTHAGKAREMGLGPFPDVTLAEARERAAEARKQIRDGTDPIDQRKAVRRDKESKARSITFRGAAEQCIATRCSTWRNERHRAQWSSSLAAYAYPVIGDLAVNAISPADVVRVLKPIWDRKPETASRVRSRIEAVLDYATALHWRTGENPARWRGHLANVFTSRRGLARALHAPAVVKHHAALPWTEIAAFFDELRRYGGIAARALEFTILTASRTGETLGATWSELDLTSAAWTIPAARTKGGRGHRVPLAGAAIDIVKAMGVLRDGSDGYVFPGGKAGRPLSGTAMRKVLRRMGRASMTVHGFRSAFRDFAAEATNHPREVAEQALAHTLADRTEAAYRRGDLFDKRRVLMRDWAGFCSQGVEMAFTPDVDPQPTHEAAVSTLPATARRSETNSPMICIPQLA
jgi:integrase